MAAIRLSKDVQARLGRQSERLADIGRHRLRRLAIQQAKTDDFHLGACPEFEPPAPELLRRGTAIIEFAGLPTARSGIFLKWIETDRNRCLIQVHSGIGEKLALVSNPVAAGAIEFVLMPNSQSYFNLGSLVIKSMMRVFNLFAAEPVLM